MGWFDKLSSALTKTKEFMNRDIRDLFNKEGELVDEQFLAKIYEILIKTDMGAGPATEIRDQIGYDFRARVMFKEDMLKTIAKKIREQVQNIE